MTSRRIASPSFPTAHRSATKPPFVGTRGPATKPSFVGTRGPATKPSFRTEQADAFSFTFAPAIEDSGPAGNVSACGERNLSLFSAVVHTPFPGADFSSPVTSHESRNHDLHRLQATLLHPRSRLPPLPPRLSLGRPRHSPRRMPSEIRDTLWPTSAPAPAF